SRYILHYSASCTHTIGDSRDTSKGHVNASWPSLGLVSNFLSKENVSGSVIRASSHVKGTCVKPQRKTQSQETFLRRTSAGMGGKRQYSHLPSPSRRPQSDVPGQARLSGQQRKGISQPFHGSHFRRKNRQSIPSGFPGECISSI